MARGLLNTQPVRRGLPCRGRRTRGAAIRYRWSGLIRLHFVSLRGRGPFAPMKSIIRQPSVGNATAGQLPASRFLRIFDLFRSTFERTFLADALRAADFDF